MYMLYTSSISDVRFEELVQLECRTCSLLIPFHRISLTYSSSCQIRKMDESASMDEFCVLCAITCLWSVLAWTGLRLITYGDLKLMMCRRWHPRSDLGLSSDLAPFTSLACAVAIRSVTSVLTLEVTAMSLLPGPGLFSPSTIALQR